MDDPAENLYFPLMPAHSLMGSPQSSSATLEAIPAFFLYGEPLRALDERLVHVETIAARSALHDWNITPHRHRDLNQLLFLERGQVDVRIDDTRSNLVGPALIAVPPGSVHAFCFQPGALGIVVSFVSPLVRELSATGAGILELLERPAACPLEPAAMKETDLPSLSAMLLREFVRSAPGRQAALRGLLGALLANCLRLVGQPTETDAPLVSPDQELVARFRRLVELRYRQHLPMKAYTAELGVSEAKLRRVCLTVTGQSPSDLLQMRLLIEAERQLRYTSMPVAQIAYHLGFEDPAYFSRFFTRLTHLSPRAFRDGAG